MFGVLSFILVLILFITHITNFINLKPCNTEFYHVTDISYITNFAYVTEISCITSIISITVLAISLTLLILLLLFSWMKLSFSLYSIHYDRHLVFESSEKRLIAPYTRYHSRKWYMSVWGASLFLVLFMKRVELTLWKALKNMKNIDNIPVLT